MRRRLPVSLVLCLALSLATAGNAAELMVVPAAEMGADGIAKATLVMLNDSEQDFMPPETIEVIFVQDSVNAPVTMRREGAESLIAAGGFAKHRYAFTVPEGIEAGRQAEIQILGDLAASARLMIPRFRSNPSADVQLATTPPDSRAEPEAVAEASADGSLNFSTYRPMYALVGTSPLNAKLQFSFKYALVDPDGNAASDFSFLRGIYLGFTQTMFWDLGVESSPFRSIDFQPELFYRYRSDLDIAAFRGSDFNVQTGIKHYSNGRGDPDPELTGNPDPQGPDETDSRSFNTVYLEPSVSLPLGNDYRLTAAPRAWIYFGDLEDNPDIGSFRGNSSLRLTLARRDGARLEAYALGFVGTGRGSLQTDLSYPVRFGFLDDVNLRLHGQFFTGYGDNLFDYNRKSTRLRFGVSLIP